MAHVLFVVAASLQLKLQAKMHRTKLQTAASCGAVLVAIYVVSTVEELPNWVFPHECPVIEASGHIKQNTAKLDSTMGFPVYATSRGKM